MGSYSPFDNSTLVFKVYSSYSTDKATGNLVQNDANETYICNVQLSGSFPKAKKA